MRTIGYEVFWSMVDAIDEYIDGNFTRAKYKGLMGDEFHYARIKVEWNERPIVAIKAIILLRYQDEFGRLLVSMKPKEWMVVGSNTSLESILAMVKSRYKGKRL